MLSILILFLTLSLSALVIRVGAIALEITGLPEEKAYFQALSAFVGVGFTTREAELVMNHPERRRIIKMMIRLGGAGVITSVASLAGALVSGPNIFKMFSSSSHVGPLPVNIAQLALIVIITITYLIYCCLKEPGLNRLITELISIVLLKTKVVRTALVEELLLAGPDYGVFRGTVGGDNAHLGNKLQAYLQSGQDTKLLLVERKGEAITVFAPNFTFQDGDIATFFGKADIISEITESTLETLEKEEKKPPREAQKDALLPLGSVAPQFALKDQTGNLFELSEKRGKKNVLMLFYPKDRSFFCSRQIKEFSKNIDAFHNLDTEVIAINPESVQSHERFCTAVNSQIPVLSDPSKKTCRDYRTLMLGGLLVDRSIYIVNKSGTISYARRGRPSIRELLSELSRFQRMT